MDSNEGSWINGLFRMLCRKNSCPIVKNQLDVPYGKNPCRFGVCALRWHFAGSFPPLRLIFFLDLIARNSGTATGGKEENMRFLAI